jgi:hypothetical protein
MHSISTELHRKMPSNHALFEHSVNAQRGFASFVRRLFAVAKLGNPP